LASLSCSERFNETSTGTRALIFENLFLFKFFLDMDFLICNNYISVKFTMIEALKNTLKEKGIKPTYQRLKILDYMSQNIRNHPTVDMIYAELAKEIPTDHCLQHSEYFHRERASLRCDHHRDRSQV